MGKEHAQTQVETLRNCAQALRDLAELLHEAAHNEPPAMTVVLFAGVAMTNELNALIRAAAALDEIEP